MEPDAFTHDKEYHDIVNNKETLRKCTEKFLNNIIDELTLGIIFDTHRKAKMRGLDLDIAGTLTLEEDLPPNVDIFGQNVKKMQECECPNCDRVVSAARFAPHLENCMGMGRIRSRYASRRTASNNDNNSSYSELPSDNEDDAHWNSGDKRRKKKQRNGTKKGKGTPKKSNREIETVESLNVDIEGDEDGDINLRDFLQDSSNHSSPAESVTYTNNNSFKKKEKGKNKKSNKRDRISPSTSLAE